MNNGHIEPERIHASTISPEPLPSPKRVPIWWWIALTAVVALIAGLFIGSATKAPEIKEVEVAKEVIVEKVPQVCHQALLAYSDYGKALAGSNYSYKEFVTALEGEFNGRPTAKSQYEAFGMSIALNDSLAQENLNLIEQLVPQCNKYLQPQPQPNS